MKLWIYLGAWLYLAGILAAQCAAPVAPSSIQAAPDFKRLTRTMTWTGVPTNSSAISIAATPALGAGDSTNPIKVVLSSDSSTTTLGGHYADISATGAANDNLVEGAFFRGSNSGTGTEALAKGSWSVARNIGGGTVTEMRGAEANILALNSPVTVATGFQSEYYDNGTAVVGTANLFRGQALSMAGTTTTLNGLSFDAWAVPSGSVANSNVIKIDGSVDVGTTKHCINSASVSPSLFAGDIAYTANNRGPVLKDSVTGHFIRLTLANGVLTQTDLGTGTP